MSRPADVHEVAHGEGHPLAVAPTAPTEREPVLDVLRGIALLGILLINIEYMRSAGFYDAFVGVVPTTTLADRIAQFGMGWLAAGKYLSMFAILFGVGAALITDRAIRAGRSPRRLLARRCSPGSGCTGTVNPCGRAENKDPNEQRSPASLRRR